MPMIYHHARYAALLGLALLLASALGTGRYAHAQPAKPPTVTIVLQQGKDGYKGAEDTFVIRPYIGMPEAEQLKSQGRGASLFVTGERSRALLRFDLRDIRGTIVGARLIMEKVSQQERPDLVWSENIALYRIADANRDWQAGGGMGTREDDVAIWNARAVPGTVWAGSPGLSTPGTDFVDTALATADSGDKLDTPVTWTLNDVSFLNNWVAHPEANTGFLLQETGPFPRPPGDKRNGADRFHSSNSPVWQRRPRLELTVIPAKGFPTGLEQAHPPIPVRFTLPQAGYVTLVIEDGEGRRVRNLISETAFPAGNHTVWWNGLDESGKKEVSPRGYYKIDGKLVQPGTYKVRGLYRKEFGLVYEFSPYNPGTPPWPNWKDGTAGWLADHSAPSEVLAMPAATPAEQRVLIGSHVVEGGSALAWVDLNGRKSRGMGWLGGGHWTGASSLARDVGDKPLPDIEVYAGTTHPDKKAGTVEVRLIGVRQKENKVILVHPIPSQPGDPQHDTMLGGLAARNGLLYVTLPSRNQLLIVDAAGGKLLKTYDIPDIRGITFNPEGRLLAVTGRQVQVLSVPLSAAEAEATTKLPEPRLLVSTGLDDPARITQDAQGNLYISDRGVSHNVKVFTAEGKPLRTIGKAGVPKAGPYDEQRMNNPNGLTVTSDGRLWIAENDNAPRRVSVWNLDGTFVRAFYGGVAYGGGGQIDPRDKTRYYYGKAGFAMEFKLDWERGTDKLTSVIWRSGEDPTLKGSPERPVYAFGRQYMTNDQNDWLMGSNLARIWVMRDGMAVPVAMAGLASQWAPFKEAPEFKALLPEPPADKPDFLKRWIFAWSDRNGDAAIQPEEITVKHVQDRENPEWISPVIVQDGLSFIVGNGLRLDPASVNDAGVPLYDATAVTSVIMPEPGKGSRFQALESGDEWAVQIGAPIRGYRNNKLVWTYPCRWPGLGSMYGDPLEEPEPGRIVGITRFAGMPLNLQSQAAPVPHISPVGPILVSTANSGCLSLITRDGLYVGTIGKENRVGRRITSIPTCERGMSMSEITFGEEHFFLNTCQSADGKVYVVTAFGIVRVDGLDSICRLPDTEITLTSDVMKQAAAYVLSSDDAPRPFRRAKPLRIPILTQAPVVDGKLEDWADADWALISPARKNEPGSELQAALAIHGDRLYVACRGKDSLFRENGTWNGEFETIFKMGGALDLTLGIDPKANPKRNNPVPGDIRLIVTQLKDQPKDRTVAVLYRGAVPGTLKPVTFNSPWRSITLDRVEDVTDKVELGKDVAVGRANYEFSIPLAQLGLNPKPGVVIRGDIGVLRGKDGRTTERLYWTNKASGLTADVPGEAMLTPSLWGEFRIDEAPGSAPKP